MLRHCYEHTDPPLRSDKKEIRVLELLPITGNVGFEACCLLHTVSLLDRPKPQYSALSYVWGDADKTKSIMINGRTHNVTKNLATALKFFTTFRQDRLRDFRIWVDAICINQSMDPENHEKDEQVAMMGDLFASADEVLSWLGEDATIPTILQTLVMLHKESINSRSHTETPDDIELLKSYPELYEHDTPENMKWLIPIQALMSIRDFVELPYWSRMWIFQEIVLAKPGKLIFFTPVEPFFITGEDLNLALGLCDITGQDFLQKAGPDYITKAILKDMQPIRDLGNACKSINRLLLVRRRLCDTGLSKANHASLSILSAFRHNTRATNPLDYYYSLLGVSRLDLKPNYNVTNQVETVCMDFIRAYLAATSGSPYTLLFLHDALGGEAKAHRLPSWTPRYHLPHTMEGRDRGVNWKAGADKLVFELPPGASGLEPRLEGPTLLAEGVRIGAVQLVSDESSQDFLRTGATDAYLAGFERRHKGRYVTGIPSATAYLATLMRDEDGQEDGWKDLITMRCLSELSTEDNSQERQTWRLLKQMFLRSTHKAISCGADELMTMTSEWLRTLSEQGLPKASRLFEFEGGYLGSAPQDVEIGDVVCVLNGSQYPVILRPLPDDLFEFVGTCFVLGLMKGEARAFLSTGRRVFHVV